jgi:hypothetical protein
MPRPIRALPVLRLAPHFWKPIGYLYDMGFTRDVWMHRVDISRAVGRNFHATPEHDGRIVADIIAEWTTTHSDPYTLKLTGPAGATFVRDPADPGDYLEVDAIDCCRILSGRELRSASSTTPFPCKRRKETTQCSLMRDLLVQARRPLMSWPDSATRF